MRTFFETVADLARREPDRIAFSGSEGVLTRAGLMGDAARLAAALPKEARTVGLLLPNGRAWAVAQLACVVSGRIAVPLPTFFSPAQIAHIVRDAGIELLLVPSGGAGAAPQGIVRHPVVVTGEGGLWPAFRDGYGTLIYTSGSTGQPKGVRHESGQVGWSAAALAAAIGAGPSDSYLSVLPLSLLLESICAVFVPALVGGRTHFEADLAEAVGRGAPAGIAAAFKTHRPSVSVIVPELLRVWLGELLGARQRAPESLRFVAAGGAAVPPRLADAAWQAGIPVHEGYGLSECCSVVAMNRPGARAAGTVGMPLPGLSVSIRDGEILVDGPSVTDGYAGRPGKSRPWPTGDLGGFDADGRLFVSGRKDNLIVTALGRNVSPEWVETAILDDPGIAACAVGSAQDRLVALVVPAPAAADWFSDAGPEAAAHRVALRCAGLPLYAQPQHVVVLGRAAAKAASLLTDNGRIRRAVAAALIAQAERTPVCLTLSHELEKAMTSYDRLVRETAAERESFLSIPLVREALTSGGPKRLYLAFLAEAYHHVKHTFPLLALAASRTADARYQDALAQYMAEERGHENWILDDIRAMGGDAEAVRDGRPGPACRVMVAFAYHAIEHVSPYAMLGSVHVLEGMSVLLAEQLAEVLRRQFGAGENAGFSYLTSHGSLDLEHVAFFRTLMDGFDDPQVQDIVIDHAKMFYRLYGDIFRELGGRGELSHVA